MLPSILQGSSSNERTCLQNEPHVTNVSLFGIYTVGTSSQLDSDPTGINRNPSPGLLNTVSHSPDTVLPSTLQGLSGNDLVVSRTCSMLRTQVRLVFTRLEQ